MCQHMPIQNHAYAIKSRQRYVWDVHQSSNTDISGFMRTGFSCCMHNKSMRNKSELFKETMRLGNIVSHWSAFKCNNMKNQFPKLSQHTIVRFTVRWMDFFGKTSGP